VTPRRRLYDSTVKKLQLVVRLAACQADRFHRAVTRSD
jgi:hypothetical protein